MFIDLRMTNQEFGTLAYTKSPKTSKRTTFQVKKKRKKKEKYYAKLTGSIFTTQKWGWYQSSHLYLRKKANRHIKQNVELLL